MTTDEKRQLVESAKGCKLNGFCCTVAGWANEMAGLSPCTGGTYQVTWEAVARVLASEDKDFKRENVWMSGNWWLGYGCNEDWKMCQEEWHKKARISDANR